MLWKYLFCENQNQVNFEEPSESESSTKTKVSTGKVTKSRSAGATVKLGFEPDQILGASERNGKIIKYRIKVKNSDGWKIVSASKFRAACPQLVMEFYEKHLYLDDGPFISNE